MGGLKMSQEPDPDRARSSVEQGAPKLLKVPKWLPLPTCRHFGTGKGARENKSTSYNHNSILNLSVFGFKMVTVSL